MFKTNNEAVNKSYMLKLGSIVNSNVTIFFDFQNCKQIKSQLLDMPQKVRHYLGHFLWKEKLSMITHLN